MRLRRSLTPVDEYLTAKVASIQWRIWSELRKQAVLTCALSCATWRGVRLPGAPLVIVQRYERSEGQGWPVR